MEFWKENLLKAGTETNYDVFTALVYLDSFNHVLLQCLNVALMLTCSSRLTLKKIAQLSKVVCRYVMDSQNVQCSRKEITFKGTLHTIVTEYLNARDIN